jgi:hypothetical protein
LERALVLHVVYVLYFSKKRQFQIFHYRLALVVFESGESGRGIRGREVVVDEKGGIRGLGEVVDEEGRI